MIEITYGYSRDNIIFMALQIVECRQNWDAPNIRKIYKQLINKHRKIAN
jgi:hypothetical protein